MYKDLVRTDPPQLSSIAKTDLTSQVQTRNPSGALEAGTPSLRTADALVTLTDFFAELVLVSMISFTGLIRKQRIASVLSTMDHLG